MTRRLLASLTVYMLSIPALLFMAGMLLEAPRGNNPAYLAAVTWPTALVMHLVMSGAWIFDTRLPRFFVFAGLSVGLLGILAVPIHYLTSPTIERDLLPIVAQFFFIELLLIAPALALAFVTSKFHWNPNTSST